MHGDDVTAGGGCGAHCAVRQDSSGSADIATGKFWGSREQPGAGMQPAAGQAAGRRRWGCYFTRAQACHNNNDALLSQIWVIAKATVLEVCTVPHVEPYTFG
jgi:hypothetical protein